LGFPRKRNLQNAGRTIASNKAIQLKLCFFYFADRIVTGALYKTGHPEATVLNSNEWLAVCNPICHDRGLWGCPESNFVVRIPENVSGHG
jgi:hypothetical protein